MNKKLIIMSDNKYYIYTVERMVYSQTQTHELDVDGISVKNGVDSDGTNVLPSTVTPSVETIPSVVIPGATVVISTGIVVSLGGRVG